MFQLAKHEVLSDGEGFQEETEDLEEEDTGILNSEQEWLWNGSPSNLPNANIAETVSHQIAKIQIELSTLSVPAL